MFRKITVLGSTGSIGRQTLELVEFHGIEVYGLACHSQTDLLLQQIEKFRPQVVAVSDEQAARKLREYFSGSSTPKIYSGAEGVVALAAEPVDLVVAAIVGMAGLEPCLKAAEVGNQLALANKEALVCAGELLLEQVRAHDMFILPVDSEHWAIFDCLGDKQDELKSIYLTASGGPFRGATRAELAQVTLEQALNHPTWAMGPKITIDSATLMNKGLEMIEAAYLFNVKEEEIKPIVHPQSIVHSAVLWQDGSCTAQLGVPDMRLPIQGVLSYPKKVQGLVEPFDFLSPANRELTFEAVDEEVFACLRLARSALHAGGLHPLVLNAANEVAVWTFLRGDLPFLAIEACIEHCLERYAAAGDSARHSYAELIELDRETRVIAKEYLKKYE